jgi:hypothetical protein
MIEILKDEEVCTGCGNSPSGEYNINDLDGERFAYCKECDGNIELEYINTNNEYILDELSRSFEKENGFLDNHLLFSWFDKGDYAKKAYEAMKKRLDVGALEYGQNIPISEEECLESNRNNQNESMQEVEDALIYQQAAYARDSEFLEKKGRDVIVIQLHSMIIDRLIEVYKLQCKLTERMNNKINVNP